MTQVITAIPEIIVVSVGEQGPPGIPGSSGGGSGANVNYFLDETLITAGNYTLSPMPTGLPETIRSVVCNTTLNGGVEYLNRYSSLPLGGTSIEGGEWVFYTYAATLSSSGVNEIITRVNRSVAKTGITVTFTGAGATRTVVATGGAPFVPGDVATPASILTSTLVRTASQTAWISGFVSSSEVTVTLTDPAYVNESGVALTHMYYLLFSVSTGDITEATVSLFELRTVQPSFPIAPTDSIVAAYFGRTDRSSNRTITLYSNGAEHYTHISTPLRIRHSDLGGLNENGYQHLSVAEKTRVLAGALGAYTVGSLPSGVAGNRAYVTDASAPTFLGALTGGGGVVCPVFHNGVAWVSA